MLQEADATRMVMYYCRPSSWAGPPSQADKVDSHRVVLGCILHSLLATGRDEGGWLPRYGVLIWPSSPIGEGSGVLQVQPYDGHALRIP